MLVVFLPKEGPYRAILIGASKDHIPCVSSGDPPKAAAYMPQIPGGPTQAFSTVASAGLTCRELEKSVLGEMGLLAKGKSRGLRVRPTCVSNPSSATTRYKALGRWLNMTHI